MNYIVIYLNTYQGSYETFEDAVLSNFRINFIQNNQIEIELYSKTGYMKNKHIHPTSYSKQWTKEEIISDVLKSNHLKTMLKSYNFEIHKSEQVI